MSSSTSFLDTLVSLTSLADLDQLLSSHESTLRERIARPFPTKKIKLLEAKSLEKLVEESKHNPEVEYKERIKKAAKLELSYLNIQYESINSILKTLARAVETHEVIDVYCKFRRNKVKSEVYAKYGRHLANEMQDSDVSSMVYSLSDDEEIKGVR